MGHQAERSPPTPSLATITLPHGSALWLFFAYSYLTQLYPTLSPSGYQRAMNSILPSAKCRAESPVRV